MQRIFTLAKFRSPRRASSVASHRKRSASRLRRLVCEPLEDRRMLSVFNVNTFLDTVDINPGDGIARDASGHSSLRAAIMEANALSGPDTINLPANTYSLTITGGYDTSAATGDLDISSDVTIVGAAAATTIIDATGLNNRIFDVQRGSYDLVLEHLTLTGGQAVGDSTHSSEDQGGAIRMDFYTSVTISNCLITGNSAPRTAPGSIYGFGGAISSCGALTILDSTFEGNSVSNSGGVLYVGGSGATTLIRRSTFSGNSAHSGGGVIYNHEEMTIEDSTLSGNQASGASGAGGAIDNNGGGDLTLINCTLSGNSATFGGGVENFESLELLNCTIADNDATYGGGIMTSKAFSLENTVVAGNTAASRGPDVDGAVSSAGHNLIGNTAGSTGFGPSDLVNVDARLAPLADNGGPTQTHALLPDSPAIDTANSLDAPSTDQRGVARPQGAQADIGAYEFEPIGALVVSTAVDESDGIYSPGDLSLREALLLASLRPGDDSISFDLPPDDRTIFLSRGELSLDSNVSIEGPGASLLAIDASQQSIVFYVTETAQAAISGLTIRGGSSLWIGGGIINTGTLTLTDVVITNNVVIGSYGAGGGIYNNGTLTISDAFITNNAATGSSSSGGGIYNAGANASLTIKNSTVAANMADYGGGIYSSNASLTLIGARFPGNSADAGGGGVHVYSGTLIAANSVFVGNVANYGGAIHSNAAQVAVANSLIAGNCAIAYGGGIYDYGQLIVHDTTITGNGASVKGGGIKSSAATPTITNSIISLNDAFSDPNISGSMAPESGFNLTDLDPLFIDFKNHSQVNFGPDAAWGTPDDILGDFRLTPQSFAVDAGSNTLLPADTQDFDGDGDIAEPLPVDLSGNPRIQYETVDIGAYEYVLSGDLNGDKFVGADDLDMLRANWGRDVAPGRLSQGDPSGDGFVGGDDVDIIRANWGQHYWSSPADLNRDGFVGADDLDIIRANWGRMVARGDRLAGDLSGDGFVGADDLDIIRAYWGDGAAPAPSMPLTAEATTARGNVAVKMATSKSGGKMRARACDVVLRESLAELIGGHRSLAELAWAFQLHQRQAHQAARKDAPRGVQPCQPGASILWLV